MSVRRAIVIHVGQDVRGIEFAGFEKELDFAMSGLSGVGSVDSVTGNVGAELCTKRVGLSLRGIRGAEKEAKLADSLVAFQHE